MKKHNILSFSEYRVKNAIYIQKEISENQFYYRGSPLEISIANVYAGYLRICGIDIDEKVRDLSYKYSENNLSYDANVHNNFADVMDHIMDNEYLKNKYNIL